MRAEPYGRPQAVDSYESEGAVVFLLIRSDEYSFHESRVGVGLNVPVSPVFVFVPVPLNVRST
jgi:hypothetical protein